jgi:MFS family permease
MDRLFIYICVFLRAVAIASFAVAVGIYLPRIGVAPGPLGIVLAAGLTGGAVAALLVTLGGDRLGRRRTLVLLALAAATGSLVFALARAPAALAAAAFLGMLNAMGRDRGALLVVEQAILPSTVPPALRTRAFAWYNALQDAGHAVGSGLAALPALLERRGILDETEALRAVLLASGALSIAAAVLYLRLSLAVETPLATARPRLSPESGRVIARLSALFSIDGLGGGFLVTALIAYFLYKRFGVAEGSIGLLFVAARVLNAVSHFGAAFLARRIGLVNTMVFTHLPSSLFLMAMPFAPSFPVAAALFLLRESLVEMDVPARQSYVMAVVRPEERVQAAGITALVRLGAWAVAPLFAGLFMQAGTIGTPLFAGGGLKILYDLLLYKAFRKVAPPEEAGRPKA